MNISLYTMGDLHLSFSTDKPMDIFGDNWADHTSAVKSNWQLGQDDTIVLTGDLSWGMNLEEADADFAFTDSLPGRKILVKGNHDYWWETQSKLKAVTEKYPSIHFLFNNTYEYDDCFICGTRGWVQESNQAPDIKIILREANRLRMSLESYAKTGSDKPAVVFLHYPPVFGCYRCSEIMDVMHEYGVKKCFYGHLHGGYAHRNAKEGDIEGIEMKLVSCDKINFTPYRIC